VRVTWVKTNRRVEWLGKIPSGRVGLTDQERVNEARSYFPGCYSKAFDDCIDKGLVTAYPNCARILELWGNDKTAPVSLQLDAVIDQMPYCSAPSTATSSSDNTVIWVVGAVALAAVAGYALAGGF